MAMLEVNHLAIQFGGLRAVDGFNVSIEKGQLYGLIGPNGAGKTTIFNLLTGVYKPNAGSIVLDDTNITGKSTIEINQAGIARTFQNIRLFKDMPVLDNVKVGLHNHHSYSTLTGILRLPKYHKVEKEMNEKAQALLDSMGLSINAQTEVKDLSIASRQMVEIAKALSVHSDVLVLDEPTSSLSLSETETLFNIIRKLRDEGVGIIYISHRLEEFDDIVDRVTVLRDGKYITTQPWSKEYNIPQLIRDMVGREMNEEFPKRNSTIGDVIFEVKNLTRVVNEKKIYLCNW